VWRDSVGSGFAISPALVVTAAHVVANGQVIRMIQGTSSTAGKIIGIDERADVALVRTASDLDEPSLKLARRAPQEGDQTG